MKFIFIIVVEMFIAIYIVLNEIQYYLSNDSYELIKVLHITTKTKSEISYEKIKNF